MKKLGMQSYLNLDCLNVIFVCVKKVYLAKENTDTSPISAFGIIQMHNVDA